MDHEKISLLPNARNATQTLTTTNRMNEDIISHIFQYLNFQDVLRASLVNKTWYNASLLNEIWEKRFYERVVKEREFLRIKWLPIPEEIKALKYDAETLHGINEIMQSMKKDHDIHKPGFYKACLLQVRRETKLAKRIDFFSKYYPRNPMYISGTMFNGVFGSLMVIFIILKLSLQVFADPKWWLLLLPFLFIANILLGIPILIIDIFLFIFNYLGYKSYVEFEEGLIFLPFAVLQIGQILIGIPLILKLGLQLKLTFWIMTIPLWLFIAFLALSIILLIFVTPWIDIEKEDKIFGFLFFLIMLVLLVGMTVQIILIFIKLEWDTIPFWIVFLPSFILGPLIIIFTICISFIDRNLKTIGLCSPFWIACTLYLIFTILLSVNLPIQYCWIAFAPVPFICCCGNTAVLMTYSESD